MTMEVITNNGEQALLDILPSIQNEPEKWMSVHVNISPINVLKLKEKGLSSEALKHLRDMSEELAEKLLELGLREYDGKVMVFEDTDVLALFVKTSEMQKALGKIKDEFRKNRLLHILKIEEMQDRLDCLITLSEEKVVTAEDYRKKKLIVKISEDHSEWIPAPEITEEVRKKRSTREASCVLVIEDDVLMRGLLVNILKRDHEVIQAKNASNGIISYIEHAPDVVLLDIKMPGVSGHDALKRIKQIDPESYVVMLSGLSTPGNVVTSRYSGAAGFLAKPISRGKLKEYIENCPTLKSNKA